MIKKDNLNLLNGQAMYDYFKTNSLDDNGIYIPFNEAMCQGDTTEDIFSEEFIKCRCNALSVTQDEYFNTTMLPLQPLFNQQFADLILWFDEDMFCQINLLTILAYLEQIEFKRKITYNLVDRNFKIIKTFKLYAEGYKELYKTVLLEHSIPFFWKLSPLQHGISLYFEYRKNDNEINQYIKSHIKLNNDILVNNLINTFNEYGLGDLQYNELIEKIKKN